MTTEAVDTALETNAYAISYRLLGDAPAARAVAGIAAERLRQAGGMGRPDWLYLLVQFTLDQTVEPGVLEVLPDEDDTFTGMRGALRRRLERATPDARVAGSLLHLAGYPAEMVAGVVGHTPEETIALAGIIAPPPGLDYKDLGDPALTQRSPRAPVPRRRRRVHWTTLVAVALAVLLVLGATQLTGPRPTLGPRVEEGGLGPAAPAAVEAPGTLSGTGGR